MNKHFDGFQENDERVTGIPDAFFSEILPYIIDINELKLCLYLLWKVDVVGDFGMPFTLNSILLDKLFTSGLQSSTDVIKEVVAQTMEMAADDHFLVKVKNKSREFVYFINCPQGKKAAKEYNGKHESSHTTLDHIKPNTFRLYQENIGPLTPLIADALRSAEKDFPAEWIEEAIQIAVQNNVRRWRYVETILDRWQKEGRDGTDRKDDKEDYRRYIKGEYGEIGHH
jgi:DNA replication protein